MGVSDYVKKAEQHDRLIEKEGILRESFSAAHNIEAEKAMHKNLDSLLQELASYREDEVARERRQWEQYCKQMKDWRLEHFQAKPDSDDMARGMTEPNRPHYEVANND